MTRPITFALCLLALALSACAPNVAGTAAATRASTERGPETPSPSVAPTYSADAAPQGAGSVEAGSTTGPRTETATPRDRPGDRATVVRVIDGDTIVVEIDGRIERVRFVLVDTPEVYGGIECFGKEASAFTAGVLPAGTAVWLERDFSERDRYNRLLRYVYLADGRMVNDLLVAEGFATVATFPPDLKYLDRLRNAEADARAAARGLWSACGDAPAPVATAVATAPTAPVAPPPAPARAACDPSYPDVCLPAGAADYDCAGGSGNGPNYIQGPIRVMPPDPHRLDRDGNGWGCE